MIHLLTPVRPLSLMTRFSSPQSCCLPLVKSVTIIPICMGMKHPCFPALAGCFPEARDNGCTHRHTQ